MPLLRTTRLIGLQKIISCTSLPKINQLFGPFDTAKEVWDYLAATNTVSDFASQYQIDLDLHRLRQPQDAQTGKVVGTGCKVDRLFVLDHLHLPSTSVAAASTSSKALQLWHSRLGHASLSKLRRLVSSGHFGSTSLSDFHCLPCQLSLSHPHPVPSSLCWGV
ncbi:hypothetical protein RJ639_028956 [Escallonia herrerae]|uniref:GAG-pre-integrase domain-containing protein n=1 Tax=Escallonia herrerae TaxID=1293975 RepID=A0AA88XDW3_9ASTE|nr:hypothetical protein RJ639_028956 [Escallonia herrerae]